MQKGFAYVALDREQRGQAAWRSFLVEGVMSCAAAGTRGNLPLLFCFTRAKIK